MIKMCEDVANLVCRCGQLKSDDYRLKVAAVRTLEHMQTAMYMQ